jgi:hypothetical protein
MKKAILTLIGTSLLGLSFSQVEAGLSYNFGVNSTKPTSKTIESNGLGVVNSVGLTLNFPLNNKISLATGLEFDFESIKYAVTAGNALYYNYNDVDIIRKGQINEISSLYHLTERKYKMIYGTIPTMLLFRTKPVGDYRYYGKFGARTSFLLSSSVFDKGFLIGPGLFETAQENTDMKSSKDLFFLRSSIGLALGTEWNFTGDTWMFVEIGYFYGITPIHQGKSLTGDEEKNMSIFKITPNGYDYMNFAAKQKQILLKIGILF